MARERDALVPAPAGRAFRLEAPLARVVATDCPVTVDTSRYSVPFTLIGQPFVVMPHEGFLQVRHRRSDRPQCTSAVLDGRFTEAIALDVDIRDLACYQTAYGLGGAQ